ncbi:hypothetical protein A2U01_0049387, partial [Trifolium medium]|nr:hypothetical protein [Trifolium medium]
SIKSFSSLLSTCIKIAFFCKFWHWRNAHSCVAQCAVFFYFLVLLLVLAQRARMFGATHSRCWGLSCFLLVAALRAGVACAARSIVAVNAVFVL